MRGSLRSFKPSPSLDILSNTVGLNLASVRLEARDWNTGKVWRTLAIPFSSRVAVQLTSSSWVPGESLIVRDISIALTSHFGSCIIYSQIYLPELNNCKICDLAKLLLPRSSEIKTYSIRAERSNRANFFYFDAKEKE